MPQLPKSEESYWRNAYVQSLYPPLDGDLTVDVTIVGGGITGLTSAYLLKKAGLNVAVLEKRTVGAGTTGRTTGKVTSQHNLIYNDLQERSGKLAAQTYAEANQAAVELVAAIIKKERIDCDWEQDGNYVFTNNPKQILQFKQEAETAAALGLPASFETSTPLPFDIKAAVKFTGQSKIHAQKYVLGLAQAVHGSGSYVFENSKVTGIKDGSPARVKTNSGTIFSKDIIVATNVPTMPLMARGGYCILEYPTESYIVAGRLSKNLKGMYISPDSRHYSILPVKVDGQQLLLVGGGGHVSGLRGSTEKRYQRLAEYAEKHFDVTEITHRWSDRDYLAYDSIPLIGKLYSWSKHVYVGSAFKKWGLSNGTVAGMILHDLITGKENKWANTFDSTRLKKPISSIPNAVISQTKQLFSS